LRIGQESVAEAGLEVGADWAWSEVKARRQTAALSAVMLARVGKDKRFMRDMVHGDGAMRWKLLPSWGSECEVRGISCEDGSKLRWRSQHIESNVPGTGLEWRMLWV